ncbi:MAG: hypothetical protein JWQ09_496, partial [Segetibacter sp.]|nr:hypothetical protein [Segetibacter sp.]
MFKKWYFSSMKETRDYIVMFFCLLAALFSTEDHFKIQAWPSASFFSNHHWITTASDLLTIILFVFLVLCIVGRIDRPNKKEAQIIIDINDMTSELAGVVIETCNGLISKNQIKIICKQFEEEINIFFKNLNYESQKKINLVIDSQFYESMRMAVKDSTKKQSILLISTTLRRLV